MLRYCSLPIRPDAPAVRTRLYRNGVLLDEQLLSIGRPAQMWAELPLPGGSRATRAPAARSAATYGSGRA